MLSFISFNPLDYWPLDECSLPPWFQSPALFCNLVMQSSTSDIITLIISKWSIVKTRNKVNDKIHINQNVLWMQILKSELNILQQTNCNGTIDKTKIWTILTLISIKLVISEYSYMLKLTYLPRSYIVAVSFIGGGNRRTRRKPSTCCKSLTNFIT